VPYVRFSRDKRGYEYLSLVQPSAGRRGKASPVLYWFRTPPGIRVGRKPFDEFARRTLERRHPEIAFDWEALSNTPIPPPAADVEKWRERRRQEKAARQAVRTDEASRIDVGEPATMADEVDAEEAPADVQSGDLDAAPEETESPDEPD
jgi:hypothetical protein